MLVLGIETWTAFFKQQCYVTQVSFCSPLIQVTVVASVVCPHALYLFACMNVACVFFYVCGRLNYFCPWICVCAVCICLYEFVFAYLDLSRSLYFSLSLILQHCVFCVKCISVSVFILGAIGGVNRFVTAYLCLFPH